VSQGELFRALSLTATRAAERPALTFLGPEGPRSYTFGSLLERVHEISHAIERAGLAPGGLIGLLLRTQEAQTLHYLSALAAGLVPAILTPPNRKLNREYYAETMNVLLARSEFAAIVSDVEVHGPGWPSHEPFTFEPRAPDSPLALRGRERAGGSFMQFSSGTTGIKRGVFVSDAAALAQIHTYAEAIGLGPDDVIVSWLPLYHDMGFIACLNMPLVLGVHTVMLDPIDWVAAPASFLSAVSDYGGTLAWNPNFAYAFMASRVKDADLAGVELSSIRGLVNCSEPVTYESQRRFQERFAGYGLRADAFWGCYAMAETTFALTHGTAGDPGCLDDVGPTDGTQLSGAPQVSVGRVLPGVELAVMSPAGDQLGDRVVGELWVRSPFTFTGYDNDDDATAAAFHDGWYRTGDLGYRVGEELFVVGRQKDVMIVSGVNVFPNDVEELVSTVRGVTAGRVSAFSSFDATVQTERIVVLFEPSAPADDADVLRTTIEIRTRILAAFQLANFDVRDVPAGWLVKSSSGKMARSANRRKWAAAEPAGARTREASSA
jgi:acyl-CoA synthetase (AMP-forming)/AMP-acid ligase II